MHLHPQKQPIPLSPCLRLQVVQRKGARPGQVRFSLRQRLPGKRQGQGRLQRLRSPAPFRLRLRVPPHAHLQPPLDELRSGRIGGEAGAQTTFEELRETLAAWVGQFAAAGGYSCGSPSESCIRAGSASPVPVFQEGTTHSERRVFTLKQAPKCLIRLRLLFHQDRIGQVQGRVQLQAHICLSSAAFRSHHHQGHLSTRLHPCYQLQVSPPLVAEIRTGPNESERRTELRGTLEKRTTLGGTPSGRNSKRAAEQGRSHRPSLRSLLHASTWRTVSRSFSASIGTECWTAVGIRQPGFSPLRRPKQRFLISVSKTSP